MCTHKYKMGLTISSFICTCLAQPVDSPDRFTVVVQSYHSKERDLQYIIDKAAGNPVICVENGSAQYKELSGKYEINHRENYGRDLGAFIWFVIQNYDTLDGVYIFTPANLSIHYRKQRIAYMLQEPSRDFSSPARTSSRCLQRLFRRARLHYVSTAGLKLMFACILYLNLFMPHDYNFTIDQYKGEKLSPSLVRPYGRWYEKYIGKWPEGNRICCRNGQFITNSTRLRSKPIEFYKCLLENMQTPATSETVHYVERAAADVFG